MIGQVLKTIFRYNMLPTGARAGVAVSGGADSVALLHVLQRLAKARKWRLHVLHLNHLLRGQESEGDQAFVEQLAATLGVPCFSESMDVRAAAAGSNLEQAARELRYKFFASARAHHNLDVVATGHSASDQAETVLMRLLRGTAPDSLAGIRAVNDGWIVRPFLDLPRDRIRAWLRAEGIAWREDSSNLERCYDRNRLRHEVLPLLRNEWNPQVEGALARLAASAARDENYWSAQVETVWAEAATNRQKGVLLSVERLRREHPALQSRVLKRALDEVRSRTSRARHARPSNAQMEGVLELVCQPEGDGRVSLPGLEAWRSFSQILLHEGDRSEYKPTPVDFAVPGAIRLTPQSPVIHARRPDSRAGAYNEGSNWLDGSLAPGPLLLRPWRSGDRYSQTGQRQECSLHDLLQRRKVPAWDRPEWPVLEWQGQVVWTRRFGVAFGWRANPGSACPIEIVEEPVAVQDESNFGRSASEQLAIELTHPEHLELSE